MLVLLSCASLSSHGVPSIAAADVDDVITDPPDLVGNQSEEADIQGSRNATRPFGFGRLDPSSWFPTRHSPERFERGP